ncbi:MAG TPA: hypothetical protein VI895_04655 [Bdellovibrionota bacterium]|nr:hypothetical protein [Bdellovibrionota bacterium]
MKKRDKQDLEDFDQAFERGEVSIDFSKGLVTEGLSKMVKLPPIDIPSWLAVEIEKISKLQGNSRSSVIRQLLSAAVEGHRKAAGST